MHSNGAEKERLKRNGQAKIEPMMRVLGLLACLMIGMTSFAQGSKQCDASEISQKVCAAMESAKTMTCDFTQTRKAKMLKDAIVMKGRLYTQQPNMVRWECKQPNSIIFVTDGKNVKVSKDGKLKEANLENNKIYKRVMRLSKGKMSIADILKSGEFIQTATETSSEWVIVLEPQRKELKQVIASITIHADKADAIVRTIILTDKNGDTTTLELKNIETNKKIDASLFNIGQ